LARLKDEQGTPFAPAIGATRPSPNKYVPSLPGMAQTGNTCGRVVGCMTL
jgi:hypothetical protein